MDYNHMEDKNINIDTCAELAEHLMQLGDRPLCQVITITLRNAGRNIGYFNQLDNYMWDDNEKELEIVSDIRVQVMEGGY